MDYWTLALILSGLSLLVYYYGFSTLDHFKKRKIPHVKPWPFFGNMAPIIFRRKVYADYLVELYNLYPEAKYIGFFDFMTPVVIVRDLDMIKTIAVKNFDHFTDHRTFFNEQSDPLMGRNLLALKGEVWKNMRNVLTPSFTSSKLKNMFPLISKCAEDFASCMAEKTVGKEDKSVEVKHDYTRYTNDIIATTAFGVSIDSMKNPDNEFYKYGSTLLEINGLRVLKIFFMRSFPLLAKLFKVKILNQASADYLCGVVREVVEKREKQGISRPDMIQLMMDTRGKGDDKHEISINEMLSQAIIFFIAGFDTTASLLSFASYELAVNVDVQEKLRKEIDEVLKSTNGQPGYDDISNTKYLEAVLNETLRLYPFLPFVERLCVEDYELPPPLPGCPSYKVKKGTSSWFPLYAIQRDPKFYEDPNKFKPERFMDDKLMEPTFMPFGIGPRKCIGNRFGMMESKILLFHMISKCKLEPCAKTKIPLVMSKASGFRLQSVHGHWLKVTSR